MKINILKQINKIKSWHIVLLGIIIQLFIGYSFYSASNNNIINANFGIVIISILGMMLILGVLIGIIPLILLYFKKTRKIGGIVSIILGVVGIIINIDLLIGIFMIIAGIIALYKGV